MVLRRSEERMVLAVHLQHLHALARRARRYEVQATRLELVDQLRIHLETMAMALRNLWASHSPPTRTLLVSVQLSHHALLRSLRVAEHRHALAQTHGSTLLLHVVLGHRHHHRMLCRLRELLRVGALQPQHVSAITRLPHTHLA